MIPARIFLDSKYELKYYKSFRPNMKDTFTACLCRGDALDHAPETSLFVLVLASLVHLPPCHGDSLDKNGII